MSNTIEQAREWINAEIENWLRIEPSVIGRSAEEAVLWWTLGCKFVKMSHRHYIDLLPGLDVWLLEKSFHDPAARALFRRIVTSKLTAKMPLTDAESDFAAFCLEDSLPKLAKHPGPARSKHFERNFFIAQTVSDAVLDFRFLRATRNDFKKDGSEDSAADLVAQAFAQQGRPEVTYRTVKEIVTDREFRRICETIWSAIDRQIAADEVLAKTGGRNFLAGLGE